MEGGFGDVQKRKFIFLFRGLLRKLCFGRPNVDSVSVEQFSARYECQGVLYLPYNRNSRIVPS